MSTRLQSWTRQVGQGICIAALLLGPAAAAVGQQVISLSTPGANEADRLHRRADALTAAGDSRQWRQVAKMLEQAAALRAVDDPVAVREQLVAAQLFHFAGSLGRAQANLEGAARQALANGRLVEAADAFLMAAVVANARHRPQQALALARQAQQLARSPHLSQDQCDCILNRVVWHDGKQIAAQ